MTNTAWVFPGQGSQAVGMGLELARKYPEIAKLYNDADEILGYLLSQLCFEGPEDKLTRTDNAQPALLITSLAHLRVLQLTQPEILDNPPLFVAGHSLGEYTALVASGVLSLEDGLRLVRLRGQLMNEAGAGESGSGSGMVAVIGGDEVLEKVAAETGCEIANYNSPGQTAVSGTKEALAKFSEAAKAAGVRKVIPLPVSAAFHSSLMRPMAHKLGAVIAGITFHPAQLPVISNVTAQPLPLTDPEALKNELVTQTFSPVRWIESVRTMYAGGATRFIEIGPGNVLGGLIRRIEKAAEVVQSEQLLKN